MKFPVSIHSVIIPHTHIAHKPENRNTADKKQ